ncbi:MAG: site-specific integrase [Acidimicrobiales bacterium]
MANVVVRRGPRGVHYDVRFRDPNGRQRKKTFPTRKDAERFAVSIEADKIRGGWIDPDAGRIKLREYATGWLGARPRPLRPRTSDLYSSLLRVHIFPTFGETDVNRITPVHVREWNAKMMRSAGPRSTVPAKAYRLLRAILATAVEDELIPRNPCLLRGAGVEHSAERPTVTPQQVWEIADVVEPRFRAMVLLAGFVGLRLGELLGLRRKDLNLLRRSLTVDQQLQQLDDGSLVFGPPKTDAGRRTLALPRVIVSDLERHLSQWTDATPDALVFTGAKGGPLRKAVWHQLWQSAVRQTSAPEGFRFHDLRHTANTISAGLPGVTTRDLMRRMGHASPRAALIYQHSTAARDQAVADAVDEVVASAHGTVGSPPA